MSSSRINLALAKGKLVVTNNESTSCSLELVETQEDDSVRKEVIVIRSGQTFNLTKMRSVKDLRKSTKALSTIAKRRLHVHKTW